MQVKQSNGVLHATGTSAESATTAFGVFDDLSSPALPPPRPTPRPTPSTTSCTCAAARQSPITRPARSPRKLHLDCVIYTGAGTSTLEQETDDTNYRWGDGVKVSHAELTTHGDQSEGAGSFDRTRHEVSDGVRDQYLLEPAPGQPIRAPLRDVQLFRARSLRRRQLQSLLRRLLRSCRHERPRWSTIPTFPGWHGLAQQPRLLHQPRTTGFGSFDNHTSALTPTRVYSFSSEQDHLVASRHRQDDRYYEAGSWSAGSYSLSKRPLLGDGMTSVTLHDDPTVTRGARRLQFL